MRALAGRSPGGPFAAAALSGALAPAFRLLVAAMIVSRPGRRAGVEALAAALGAAGAARIIRDAVGRPRPGPRTDGGMPSRHAAAATAIARAVGRHHPGLAPLLVVAAGAGLAARVASAEHDPADIAAGVALGWAADRLVQLAAGTRGRG